MRKTAYTTKEMNEILAELKIKLEAEYTIEHLKTVNPIDRKYAQQHILSEDDFHRDCNVDIDELIEKLQDAKTKGADTIRFDWSYGDWAEDEPMQMKVILREYESEAEYQKRIEKRREQIVYEGVYAKNRELQAHNQQVYEYTRLKKQFGE